MNFEVEVNGRPWKVALDAAEEPGRVTVSVKGRRRTLDVAWIDAGTLSLVDVESGATREIGIGGGHGDLDVVIDGTTFRAVASVAGRSSQRVRSESRPSRVEGRQTVVAPMPGRVVRVLVAVGDRVTAGQAVVIVEAMKMENELRAPKDGVVREVFAREGGAVEAGAVLVVMDDN
ncbi:MAG: biotin/lipoyl-binding protein [Acidobacteria bacterium]|nr:biotin/lipoyl-binding protein [Acidobacteriota bacterium]